LKSPTYKTFKDIRQLIADFGISDFDPFYSFLYQNVSKFSPNNEGIITIIINDYMFQSVSVVDKEICFMAMISKIIEKLK